MPPVLLPSSLSTLEMDAGLHRSLYAHVCSHCILDDVIQWLLRDLPLVCDVFWIDPGRIKIRLQCTRISYSRRLVEALRPVPV